MSEDMPKKKSVIREELNIRLPAQELDALKDYCEKTGRTMTDVIRGFVWSIIPDHKRQTLANQDPLIPSTVQFLRSTVVAKWE